MAENKSESAKRLTKAQVVTELATSTELDKKTVSKVLDAMAELIQQQLGNDGPGEFVIPGVVKLKTTVKPATQDRQGINPFTKQPMVIKGKPASKKVRASVLKALTDTVQQ